MTVNSKSAVETPTARISVVMPVFNGGPDLEKCLAAIAASSRPVFECILVDDGSTDGMTAAAAERHGARVISLQQRSGPAIARNYGAREARGDILFFIDADVLLHPDAVAVAAGALENDSGLSAVFGSYDDQPGHPSFLSQYRNLFHHWVHQTGNAQAATFWAGCGAIRREVFIDMGGFSQEYGWPSIEDIELGTRLVRSGHRIRLEKTLFSTHLKHWTFCNLVRTDIFRRGVPWMGLVLRERHAPSDLNLNLRSRIATILAGLLGLSVMVFPLSGHAAALLPAAAFLLAGAMSISLSQAAGGRSGRTLFALALAVMAPLALYTLRPDPWAVIPLMLILALIWTHLAFYRYVAHKRSGAFAIAVIPMQVLFFLGCVVAVVVGLMQHYFSQPKSGTGCH